MHLVFSKYNNQHIYFALLLILLLSFGMIFNKAHVAFVRHRLGECHIPVALKILYTQTVGTLISRCIVFVSDLGLLCLPMPNKRTLSLYWWVCKMLITAFTG